MFRYDITTRPQNCDLVHENDMSYELNNQQFINSEDISQTSNQSPVGMITAFSMLLWSINLIIIEQILSAQIHEWIDVPLLDNTQLSSVIEHLK